MNVGSTARIQAVDGFDAAHFEPAIANHWGVLIMPEDDFHHQSVPDGLSSELRLSRIAEVWCAIDCEDSGAIAIDGAALDELRFEVTEAMNRNDTDLAESLTIQALVLLSKFN